MAKRIIDKDPLENALGSIMGNTEKKEIVKTENQQNVKDEKSKNGKEEILQHVLGEKNKNDNTVKQKSEKAENQQNRKKVTYFIEKELSDRLQILAIKKNKHDYEIAEEAIREFLRIYE